MNNRLLSFVLGCLGFCVGFTLCYVLLVLPARQSSASARSRPQVADASNTARELTDLTLQLRDAYQRHDMAAYDRLWADEFVATDPSGQRRTKADLLHQMQGSGFDLKSIADIRVRDYGDSPVVTYRSIGFAKAGTNLVPVEVFSSEQYRRTTTEEASGGLGHWRAASAKHMSVHQAPPGYSPEVTATSQTQ